MDSTTPNPMTALGRYAPPLAVMALIFFLSAQSDLSSGLGVWDYLGRKLVHATEYGVLFLLWRRALGSEASLAAAAIAIAYAATDELHQTFVPGRHGTPVDVLIDAAGVTLAARLAARRLA